MDPVTAFGFAASVITFIDFSTKLVGGAYEVYQSQGGRTTENSDISNILEDLQDITEGLTTNFKATDKHEAALARLGRR